MPPFVIAIIVILIVHYFLTIFVLMKDKGLVKAIIPWNLVILLVPVLGPCAYWIYKLFARKK